MSPLPLIAALLLMTAESARAQGNPASPDGTVPAPRTHSPDEVVNPLGGAPSSVGASGAIRLVPMFALAQGVNSSTEGQARPCIADFGVVTPPTPGPGGVWRDRADREGCTSGVAFDVEGQVAFQ